MDTKEKHMADDAIYDISHGYNEAALSVLRALVETGVPRVLFIPMSREVNE
jgi:hypothetical protein